MKWRERSNVDDIANWKAPKPLVDYSPHGLSGFDNEGSPSKENLFISIVKLLLNINYF